MKGMVLKRQLFRHAVRFGWIAMGICPSMLWTAFCGPDSACAQEASAGSARSVLEIPDASAGSEKEMKPYVEKIEHSAAKIEMLPIPGGSFRMGSPDSEAGRNADEGPVHEVQVGPFWMAKFEVTWDSYDVWMSDLDVFYREVNKVQATPRDELADEFQKSQPTKPYTDMTFGMGKHGYPAICMTQHAARTFCKWLSRKTGRYYRLPTEAEWEYACRAGTQTAYSFGDDPAELENYAWFADNAGEGYHKVGLKKPNPWGLHDMHGNVAEWVLDQHTPDGYKPDLAKSNPLFVPQTLYPRVVRGGGWDKDAVTLRSSAREGSTEDWIAQDPQSPVSIWYLTDALHVGFRVVRPLQEPSEEEKNKFWEYSEPIQKERPVPLER
ncbi:MAG: Serine/threonine-protein kinase pkn1 [Planctomycetota bacterium]|jgi:formylglycine-generating enzyme required for sulfatase activity